MMKQFGYSHLPDGLEKATLWREFGKSDRGFGWKERYDSAKKKQPTEY